MSAILRNIHNMTLPLTLNRFCRTGKPGDSFDVAVNRHANLSLTENVSYVASRENHCSEVCVTEDNDDNEDICKGNVYETACVMDTKSFSKILHSDVYIYKYSGVDRSGTSDRPETN